MARRDPPGLRAPRSRVAGGLLLALVAAAASGAGCGVVAGAGSRLRLPSILRLPSSPPPVEASRAAGGGTAATNDPLFLYMQLALLSDRAVANLTRVTETSLGRVTDPVLRQKLLRIRLDYATALWNAVSGPNPWANAIDVLVTLDFGRRVLRRPATAVAFGAEVEPLLEILDAAGHDTEVLVRGFLAPSDFAALQGAIAGSETATLDSGMLESIDLEQILGRAQRIAAPSAGAGGPLSVNLLGILGVDPLAGLDPATREIAQTRQFGERLLFNLQRLPYLLRMNAELLASEVAEDIGIGRIETSLNRASEGIAQVGRAAETLPAQVSAERARLVADVRAEAERLGALARDGRAMFEAADASIEATDRALQTFGAVADRLLDRPGGTAPPSRPFDVNEYANTAARVGEAAASLDGLLARLERTLDSPAVVRVPPLAASVVSDAEASARRLLWTAFGLGCALVALAALAALAVARRLRRAAAGGDRQ